MLRATSTLPLVLVAACACGTTDTATMVAHTILVSTGPNQSFRVFVSNYGPIVPDEDEIRMGTQTARAIVENLD